MPVRMPMSAAIVAAFVLVAIATPAAVDAEILRWTDDRGRLHFAQSIDQVPVRYRAQAMESISGPSEGNFQTFTATAPSAPSSGRTFRVPFRREHDLMRVDARLNGHLDVPFYIDTGASGVSLPAVVVERLGIRIGPDTQRVAVRTANGVIEVPLVRLDSVVLDGARVEGLMATVNPTMSIGLLGGAFFNQFSYHVDPAANVITLAPNHAVQASGDEALWRRRFQQIREPIEELETYLDERSGLHETRREELEGKLALLRDRLSSLEREADRDDVPNGWRR